MCMSTEVGEGLTSCAADTHQHPDAALPPAPRGALGGLMVLLLLAVQLEAGQELQRCGLCKAVWYCSKECQKRDWRAGHKEACRGRVGEEAAAPAGSSRSA